jgi:hypothetical protein
MLATTSYAADVDNPYKTAKVGDWAKYKQTMVSAGMNMETAMKQTVTAKTDKEVTIEIAMTVQGNEMKNSMTIKLDEKYDPMSKMPAGTQSKEIASGAEKLTVAGKAIDTKWFEYETVSKAPDGTELKSKSKVWTSTVVGTVVVKMENDMGGKGKMTMDLIDFGSGK